MDRQAQKNRAGRAAVAQEVRSGMRVGLGSGSTAACAIEAIGEALRRGRLSDIVGVPTSEATARQARSLDIPLGELHEVEKLDVTIDGTDEIDPALNLIKGLGGALLREKMVAQATSGRYVVVADHSKLVASLGATVPLPVEVTTFGWQYQAMRLGRLGATVSRRVEGSDPFLTDNGNYILDCRFDGAVPDPEVLDWQLLALAGVVAHGLFLDIAHVAYIGRPDGVERLVAEQAREEGEII